MKWQSHIKGIRKIPKFSPIAKRILVPACQFVDIGNLHIDSFDIEDLFIYYS